MNERIRAYIDELFADAPKTRKAMELKEEMAINTMEKYQDLISEGHQEEDAWQIVINSIGDVRELFEELKEDNPFRLSEEDLKKKAVMKAAAAGLYIFAGVVFLTWMVISDHFFFMSSDMGMVGMILAVLLCIPPTCMLVFAANMYPDYRKNGDDLVECYKEAVHVRNREKAVKTSISAIVWLMTLILYFIISFATSHWEVTWILFLVGCCLQEIVILVFNLRREK